jgi:alpha-tubulin suppressor-like RCC1 family protein
LVNVIDIVMIVAEILDPGLLVGDGLVCSDASCDGPVNVIDIVVIVAAILAGDVMSCPGDTGNTDTGGGPGIADSGNSGGATNNPTGHSGGQDTAAHTGDTGVGVTDEDGDGIPSDVDCDDQDPGVGAATVLYYLDVDGDMFGDEDDPGVAYCNDPLDGSVTDNTDCDDDLGSVYVGAPEVCNGVDNNCVSGTIDELCHTYVPGLQLVTGGAYNCAWSPSGYAKCWGNNDKGQLGYGHTQNLGDAPGEVGMSLPVLDFGIDPATGQALLVEQLDSYWNHSCALLSNGGLRCWGSNDRGQLGQGDTDYRGDDEPVSDIPDIDVGTGHTIQAVSAGGVLATSGFDKHANTCVILDAGSVKCWGGNTYGQLGAGWSDEWDGVGDAMGEMGDSLGFVDLGTGRTAVSLTGGDAHRCALLDDGSVKCWGYNGEGTLGYGHTDDLGDDAGEMGDSLAAVDLGTSAAVLGLGTGADHSCAFLDGGEIRCWGHNTYGYCGVGTSTHVGDETKEMGTYLDPADLGGTALQMAAGRAHICARLVGGQVKCWGYGGNGRLGSGGTASLADSPSETGTNLPYVDLGSGRTARWVVSGGRHSCAYLDNAQLKCWGDNDDGTLGYGDTADRGDGAGEMGDALPGLDLGMWPARAGSCFGDFTIDSAADPDLTVLAGCTAITGDLSIESSDLTNLDGFAALVAVEGNLFITENSVLSDISGLGTLEYVGGTLFIGENNSLATLAGLSTVAVVAGDSQAVDNDLLCETEAVAILDDITNGTVTTAGNNGGCP